jgi:hypothetical protein
MDRKIANTEKARGIVRLDPAQRIQRGDFLSLRIAVEKLHIFDPHDGACLSF